MPLIATLPSKPEVIALRFAFLSAALLAEVQPDCVVLPLLHARFDAFQVLTRLQELGFCGQICTLTPPLPNRAMVEAELAQAAKSATVHLIELV